MTSKIQVSVIVYSAKGLKAKHKGKHKYLVVFGVGSNKFRTDVVEDLFDNPVFNTESEIDVDDATQPLVLVVSEKNEKDVLGQVVIPLCDLTTVRANRPTQVALRPHKRCPNPEGELNFEAWISSGGAVPRSSLASSSAMSASSLSITSGDIEKKKHLIPAGLKKLSSKISLSPMLSRKSSFGKEHKRSGSDTQKMKGSVSCHDLSVGLGGGGLKMMSNSKEMHSSNESIDSLATSSISGTSDLIPATTTVSTLPEVTGVSPREGSTEGGVKVTIRGSNLGRNKEDVIGLFVCGSNVLGSLEFISSSKLVCTTKPWRACVGNVTVETQSGGKGTSSVQFTFTSPDTQTHTDGRDSALSSSSFTEPPKPLLPPSTSSSNLQSVRNSLRGAKSMFDVSSASASPIKALPPGPEVTGVSPAEGRVEESTRLTVRGLNLGQSRSDILRVTVCGVDCVETVEYESASKIFCVVGPIPGGQGARKGDVIVETRSGGRGTSLVQFGFISQELERGSSVSESSSSKAVAPMESSNSWPVAVPYSDQQPAEDFNSESDAERLRRAGVVRIDRQSKDKVPPPVGEIQPIRVDAKKSSSPHHKGLFRKRSDKSSVDTTDHGQENNITNVLEAGEDVRSSKTEVSMDHFSELQRQLLSVEDKSNKLLQDNKQLKEENDRMKKYMESLISRAMMKCPEILCVDTSK